MAALVGGLSYLDGLELFGLRQWSFTVSCVVIGGFSLIMYRLLRRQDGVDGEFPELRWWEVLAFSPLLSLVFFAWIFGMGAIGYFGTELVTAGASVAEVMAMQIVILAVLGFVVKKTCSFKE